MAGRKKMSEIESAATESEKKPFVAHEFARNMRSSLNKDSKNDPIAWDLTKDDSPTHVEEWISTGSTLLDYTVSNRRNGGIPCGKITELQGEEAAGKSLLCAHLIAEIQRRGGVAVYLDTENATNTDFMRRIGVNVQELIYVQPGTIERCFEVIENVITTLRTKAPDALIGIFWDSVGNTPPQAEIEGDYDPNSRIGLGAKAMAKGLRKITGMIGKERIAMVFTQPLKFAMNGGYGDPWVTVYGKALPYFSSVRLRLTSSTKLKDPKNNEIYGILTNARMMKSRLGTSNRSCKFEIHYDFGIDDEQSWFAVLHDAGLIEKADGWCYIESLPSGRVWDKKGSKHFGKDRGVSFRESEFGNLCRDGGELGARVRKWAEDMLEKLLIVKFDDKRPIRTAEHVPNDESEAPAVVSTSAASDDHNLSVGGSVREEG